MVSLLQTQGQNSAGIGVISMAMVAPNIFDNKPKVKNLCRLQICGFTTELLLAILIVMQHSKCACLHNMASSLEHWSTLTE